MKRPFKDISQMDITSALRGWSFQPGQVNVRLIRGNDGKPKLQLRLDLGLLQMELNGRPDGKRPHRSPTELDFHRRKLDQYLTHHGSDNGFALTAHDCQALREESAMFYHRYLSLFVLEQYDAVIRDTQHNLDVLDICAKYGRNDYDRMCLEQYRPYIMMMQTRAKACEALRQGFVKTAMAYLRGGIRQIARAYPRDQRRKMLRHSNEATILLDMLRQIRHQLPQDPKTLLQKRLNAAIAAEKFEEAATLRDQLMAIQSAPAKSVMQHKPDAAGMSKVDSPTAAQKKSRPAKRPSRRKETDGPNP